MKKILLSLTLIFILTGCLRQSQEDVLPAETATPLPTSAPEAMPQSSITVCLGAEPNTLYPFGELNAAARSVLAAVYDGPMDMISYEYQPAIFTQMPSLENGEAQIVRTPVQVGGPVVDADGNLVTLAAGTRVRPAACRADDCVITYDGVAPLEMDQMVVTFRLRPNLTWSDGVPLTADDSFYSFELHAQTDPGDYLIKRTQIYEIADAETLQWWGVPGFLDSSYSMNFWMPAPQHLWQEFPAAELPSIDIASHTPAGWGPYAVTEWIPGDHITLEKNEYYFRAVDGYPKVDTLTFRFIPDPNTALSEMIAGRCDILDPTINLEQHVDILQEMQTAEQAQVFATTGMSIEWLGLGLDPASYDNGYNPLTDRQDFFADPRTREGITYCLNRQAVVDNVLFGLTTVPTTYVPKEHPLFDANIADLPYDPQVGTALLELAGWQDADKDPATPLRAVNVKGVSFNTQLILNYYTTPATQRRQAVEILQASLAECGIALHVEYFSPNDLYSSGPDGLLFGRRFDMAQYALGVEGFEPPCNWFTSDSIPSESNSWAGTNVTGFRSDEYDAACQTAKSSLPGEQAYLNNYRRTQIIFSDELPAIPLYYRLRIAAARPEVCRFDLDPTANPLWNIEAVGIGETCQN
ncbi:MAG: ABC transporter substrate-binding protein [Anaerolineales bacterium]|nr:ABC transporter substrate-binding protein [Anaerolineales bacterium]